MPQQKVLFAQSDRCGNILLLLTFLPVKQEGYGMIY